MQGTIRWRYKKYYLSLGRFCSVLFIVLMFFGSFSTFASATLIASMLIVNSLLLNIFYYLWVVANARTLTQ